MTNPDQPTRPLAPTPEGNFLPAIRLPEPHSHLEIVPRKPPKKAWLGANPHRWVYQGRDHQREPTRDKVLIELLLEPPAVLGCQDPLQPRYAIDLRGQADDGWPPAAVITRFPAALPPPYDHIQLVDFLGIGGMGMVFKAMADKYPDLVVKFMTLPHHHARYRAQWSEEVIAALKIDPHFIVQTYMPVDLDQDTTCWPGLGLVMRAYHVSLGEVLADALSTRCPLPPDLVADSARNLHDGLMHFHGQRFIHRDVKPSNVLVRLAPEQGYYDPGKLPHVLKGSWALLSDLGTVCRAGDTPLFTLGQDGAKAPETFQADHRASCKEDLYGFGFTLEWLGKTLSKSRWLMKVADELKRQDPEDRPALGPVLRRRLSPHWQVLDRVIAAGWRPEAHPHFTGRQHVFAAFERFAAACARQGRGGVFVVEGEAGIGKTALLAHWVGQKGPHPAYFFRQQEDRTRAAAMPEALYDALCKCHDLELPAEAAGKKDQELAELIPDLLRQIAGEKLGPDDRLLLFVDALDEADDPEKAVAYLPKTGLPARVFLIATSRPNIGERDHLATLYAAGAERFALAGNDQASLKDLSDYLLARLPGKLGQEPAERLASDLGGIFQLAVYFIEDIDQGKMTTETALAAAQDLTRHPAAKRILAWYQKQWENILHTVPDRQDQRDLAEFARLLAAALGPIGERQILRILSWDPDRRDRAWRFLNWLIAVRPADEQDYQENLLQLRHQSVYDFLVSVEHRGPARDGLEEMHQRIGQHYLELAAEETWHNVDPYGRRFALRHLLATRKPAQVQAAVQQMASVAYIEAYLAET